MTAETQTRRQDERYTLRQRRIVQGVLVTTLVIVVWLDNMWS